MEFILASFLRVASAFLAEVRFLVWLAALGVALVFFLRAGERGVLQVWLRVWARVSLQDAVRVSLRAAARAWLPLVRGWGRVLERLRGVWPARAFPLDGFQPVARRGLQRGRESPSRWVRFFR